MRRPSSRAFVALAVIAMSSGCTTSEPPASGAAPPSPTAAPTGTSPGGLGATNKKTLSVTKFGAAITETASTPLPAILNDPNRFMNQTVRTEGVVTAVCQAKGCWMQIADEAGQAHVKFAGYAFFVPREASGHRAVVQGKVVPTADRCASKDGCRAEGEKAAGAVAKVDFEATGVEFVD